MTFLWSSEQSVSRLPRNGISLLAVMSVTVYSAGAADLPDPVEFETYLDGVMSELPMLHGVLIAISLLLLLSGAIVWPVAAFRQRKKDRAFSQKHLPGAAKWTAWGASCALLLFCIGLALTMSNPREIVYGLPMFMPALLCLPLIGTALTYVAVLFGLLFCVRRIASLGARVHYLAVVTACAVLVWQLHTWNLLGFQY